MNPIVACVWRNAPVQGDGGHDGGRHLVLDQEVADLGTVAVGDDHLVVVLEQTRDRGHRDLGRGDLVLGACPAVRIGHGVSAECEQDPHALNLVTTTTPFIVPGDVWRGVSLAVVANSVGVRRRLPLACQQPAEHPGAHR